MRSFGSTKNWKGEGGFRDVWRLYNKYGNCQKTEISSSCIATEEQVEKRLYSRKSSG